MDDLLNDLQIFHFLSCMLQKKLGSYLAPFLNGMRYISFGRHFTKVDKLKEVCTSFTFFIGSYISMEVIIKLHCTSKLDSVFHLHNFSNRCNFKTYSIKPVY